MREHAALDGQSRGQRHRQDATVIKLAPGDHRAEWGHGFRRVIARPAIRVRRRVALRVRSSVD
jgi:hypothetical protein